MNLDFIKIKKILKIFLNQGNLKNLIIIKVQDNYELKNYYNEKRISNLQIIGVCKDDQQDR
ncbi:hypothetical protein FACS189415_2410 [Bacteroidia bacterium]|nr:hypothetical protein FACS189426_04600 [Bacteroidia bacterium]GHT84868.1 hypothetical protein FACS18947_2900 [Bacteroidia bacterium]GHU82267.1 hypothetical protein FACS189415_2410 [Bacteroidia bacterium]